MKTRLAAYAFLAMIGLVVFADDAGAQARRMVQRALRLLDDTDG